MQQVTLGRTNLQVGVAGLGCGGHSRLGMARGESERHASDIVRHAIDLGINFVDTARVYGTEAAVGNALRAKREQVVLSTKVTPRNKGVPISASQLVSSCEESLRELQTDYIDVFHLHGLLAEDIDHATNALVPAMHGLRESGKIRFLGVTETFSRDPGHEMLEAALPLNGFDVAMVGFNLINQSARERVFETTRSLGIGTLIMFAVRRALSQPDALDEVIRELADAGSIDVANIDAAAPLKFVIDDPSVSSLVQAAYRYCRYEPGADVILTGTGSRDHLTDNVAAIQAPPLPEDMLAQLRKVFAQVDTVSGN